MGVNLPPRVGIPADGNRVLFSRACAVGSSAGTVDYLSKNPLAARNAKVYNGIRANGENIGTAERREILREARRENAEILGVFQVSATKYHAKFPK